MGECDGRGGLCQALRPQVVRAPFCYTGREVLQRRPALVAGGQAATHLYAECACLHLTSACALLGITLFFLSAMPAVTWWYGALAEWLMAAGLGPAEPERVPWVRIPQAILEACSGRLAVEQASSFGKRCRP